MPPKRVAEVYTYLRSDTEWDSFIASTKGLLIIEIYAEWCGTCKAVHGIFKRFKHDHGDAIHFAAAESDSISNLQTYRGRCQPTFHMYASGVMVGVIHGPKGAQMELKMLDLLAREKAIATGEGVRVEVVDSEIFQFKQSESKLDVEALAEGRGGLEMPPEEQEVTLAVIKPDVVQAGKVADIIQEIVGKGISVLAQQELVLAAEFVEELYAHLRDQPQFPDLVAFMTGGPSVCLALTRTVQGEQGIVEEFRSIIGPYDTEVARVEAPSSLRAKYGTDALYNAIHASSTREQAARELAFCFPGLGSDRKGEIQRTLALIRLDSLERDREEVLGQIREAGFEIACARELQLGADRLQELSGQDGKVNSYIAKHLLETPVLALCLCRQDAVQGWLDMIGGETDPSPSPLVGGAGAFYGSTQDTEVESELDLFFPVEQTVAVIKPNAMAQKDQVLKRIEESGFHIAMQKEASLTQGASQHYIPQQEW